VRKRLSRVTGEHKSYTYKDNVPNNGIGKWGDNKINRSQDINVLYKVDFLHHPTCVRSFSGPPPSRQTVLRIPDAEHGTMCIGTCTCIQRTTLGV
jgi:hypothetical protein